MNPINNSQFNKRAYIVLGINERDPTDIIGYCENSFSMSWSRNHVNLWYEPKLKERLRTADSPKEAEEIKKFHYPQKEWNHVRHYPRFIPRGYILKVFRVNSKHCPVVVDFGYIIAYKKKLTEYWSKWFWRNPRFYLKDKNGLAVGKTQTFEEWTRGSKNILPEGTKYDEIPYSDCVRFEDRPTWQWTLTPYKPDNLPELLKKFKKERKNRKKQLKNSLKRH